MTFSKERFELTCELEMLLADYWGDVDTNWGRNAGDYYTEDAVFELNTQYYQGRAKIQEFYQYRIDRGPRTAVHTFTNFRAVLDGPNRAVSNWYLLLYAHDGHPVHPTAPPIQIAYMTDLCVKEVDGKWRYKHRKFDNWFQGGVAAMSPKLNDK